ncbi:MAG: NHLP leader peptide family RiPP precursor [Coleofasciculus chthonoplastes F3-SA18-01]|uniref:NHLP leader peptide family RiPP precursor n=1 Tax=Coleofasciculus chthonoplastes TaxID=64178 RepID=UPI0033012687
MTEPTPKNRQDLAAAIIAQAWENERFRQELLSHPKDAIAKLLGINLAENLDIRVVQETPQNLYLVLPVKPDNT